jgi:hypothetical protein
MAYTLPIQLSNAAAAAVCIMAFKDLSTNGSSASLQSKTSSYFELSRYTDGRGLTKDEVISSTRTQPVCQNKAIDYTI